MLAIKKEKIIYTTVSRDAPPACGGWAECGESRRIGAAVAGDADASTRWDALRVKCMRRRPAFVEVIACHKMSSRVIACHRVS
jgi:hypothetical protein